MRNTFLSFSRPYFDSKEKIAINRVFDSGWVTAGPITKEFENRFAEYIGCKFAIAVSSCTAALHLSLLALNVVRDDKIITTPFTFAATANVILHSGARPKFVDISSETFNIDPDKIKDYCLNQKIKPKGIMPVHFAGLPCEMDKISSIAKQFNMFVVEDAAHALGSKYKGKEIGKLSDITCFSLYPTKLITTGEGGMITTNSGKLAKKIRILSSHGITSNSWDRYSPKGRWKYKIIYPGYKYNTTDLQSAIGLCQMLKIDFFIEKRRAYCKMYDECFKNILEIEVPPDNKEMFHSRHIYPILINKKFLRINRDEFIEELRKKNIGTSVHFIPLHFHPVYRKLGYQKGDFPVCENIYSRILSLPLFPSMTKKDVSDVLCAVFDIVKKYRK